MLRRKAIKYILQVGGSLAVVGGSAMGWNQWRLTKTPDWHLLQTHRNLLAELTETILPATDTVGAKAAGVPAFVEHMVQTCLDVKSQNNFINGLIELNDYSKSTFGKYFVDTTPNEKTAILTHFDTSARSMSGLAAKARNYIAGKPFFSVLRDFTIIGYCTSELGATQSLAYDYIPGAFTGCMPYLKSQKSWAVQ